MTASAQIKDALHRAARQVVGALIGASVVGYFAYYAIQGDRGLIAFKQLQGELAEAKAVLATVRAERQQIEHRASLLRPDNLDPDMLDERVRLMLNYAHPDDIVIMLPPVER